MCRRGSTLALVLAQVFLPLSNLFVVPELGVYQTFAKVWFSLFFWHRIREEFIRSRDSLFKNSENSLYFSCEMGIRENCWEVGAQLLGTILLWDLIVVLFKVPDAPPCSTWCGNMTSRRFNDHPGFEMLELTKPYGGFCVSSLPGNIYFIRACPRSIQPYLFRDRFNEKKISRLFHDCIGQSGCAAITHWWFHDTRLHLPWISHRQYVELLKVRWATIWELVELSTPARIPLKHMP